MNEAFGLRADFLAMDFKYGNENVYSRRNA